MGSVYNINIGTTGDPSGADRVGAAIDNLTLKTRNLHGTSQQLTDAQKYEIFVREQRIAQMKRESNQALQNLGANLGYLFSIMSIGSAFQQLSSVVLEFSDASEKTQETMNKINKVIRLTTTLSSTYVTIMMLKQALTDKQTKSNLELEASELLAYKAGILKSRAANQAAASALIDAGATTAEARATDRATVSNIALATSTNPIYGAILTGLVGAAIAVAIGMVAKISGAFQSMGSFVATEPQMIMVGEHPERVNITPAGSGGSDGGNHYHLHVGTMIGDNVDKYMARFMTTTKQMG